MTVGQGRGRRSKGAGAEREVVALLVRHGWARARRNFGSGSQGGGDVVDGPAGTHIEVKRTERLRLREAYAQALAAAGTDLPVVAHRCNGGPWLATVELEELLALLRLREHAA